MRRAFQASSPKLPWPGRKRSGLFSCSVRGGRRFAGDGGATVRRSGACSLSDSGKSLLLDSGGTIMADSGYLKVQASKCRRLARQAGDWEAKVLIEMAEEYEAAVRQVKAPTRN